MLAKKSLLLEILTGSSLPDRLPAFGNSGISLYFCYICNGLRMEKAALKMKNICITVAASLKYRLTLKKRARHCAGPRADLIIIEEAQTRNDDTQFV
jgi:hypothetical protein